MNEFMHIIGNLLLVLFSIIFLFGTISACVYCGIKIYKGFLNKLDE